MPKANAEFNAQKAELWPETKADVRAQLDGLAVQHASSNDQAQASIMANQSASKHNTCSETRTSPESRTRHLSHDGLTKFVEEDDVAIMQKLGALLPVVGRRPARTSAT